ncbi:hypothetical protein C8F01DRAFT_973331 [Mycena amicta]|nr:hypothetical protein C8F01DRAFT_973331 [Mycena amicta]
MTSISGCVPGILDPDQRHRLLRRPSSTLSFASFDPRVASADHGLGMRALSLNEELYRPKRVVIETTCSGQSFWRFVPRARLDEGVEDEGTWPRVIDICGQRVECSQDQWDIYKLDIAYDCLVHASPELTVITRAAVKPAKSQPLGKHRMSSAEPCLDMPPPKTVHLDHSDDDFVEMVVDNDTRNDTHDDPDYYARNEQQDDRNAMNYSPTKTAKRTRTFSPGAAKRDLETRRLERERQKRERREREWNLRKEQKFQHFLNEIYVDVPDMPHGTLEIDDDEPPADFVDEEEERLAAIEESRRKLAELEADRPLWEQEAKKRERREREEQEALRAKADERRTAEVRKAEEERRARMEKERQKAQEEEQRRAGQERAQREKERRQRNARLSYGPWTSQRALERYNTTSEAFDNTKFSVDNPLDFDAIPWPVLHPPFSFSVEDIGWAAVEAFFTEVKVHLRPQEFVTLVQKSHRRFHPDRWRSRNLLKTVSAEAERECLEVGESEQYLRCDETECPSGEHCSSGPHAVVAGSYEALAELAVYLYFVSAMADSLRRIRSTGDIPGPISPPLVRPPPAVLPPPTQSESRPQTPPIADPLPPPTTHNVSFYSLITFFGYGRASRARKQLVSLVYNLSWGFVQIVLIVTMLSIAARTKSPTLPGRSEFETCTKLTAWNCIYIARVLLSSSLTYWGWRRERQMYGPLNPICNCKSFSRRLRAADTENAANGPQTTTNQTPSHHSGSGSVSHPNPEANVSPDATTTLPHSVLYSRLSILSSLFTLSWFLTAHILEYSSIHTCRFSAPHIWWSTFGSLVVLEVIILGFIVFVVAPIGFLFWNVVLICLGRHPMQNPGVIRPDVAKLSASVVDRIPLVIYIPPPPDAAPGSIPLPQAIYSYPPKMPSYSAPRKHRFKFLRRSKKANDVPTSPDHVKDLGAPQSWEDHWEHGGYPFVILENNRASCAICLMDFEEPKRTDGHEPAVSQQTTPPPASPVIQEVPVEPNDPPAAADGTLRLEDAGEGAQPLRLLACGHVFHSQCLDPWLTDVSGRCPVCQRAVEIPSKPTKKKRNVSV